MAEHVRFTVDTKMDVFFCGPHSPWQRGSNENTNGLLRQYLPKSANLSTYTRAVKRLALSWKILNASSFFPAASSCRTARWMRAASPAADEVVEIAVRPAPTA